MQFAELLHDVRYDGSDQRQRSVGRFNGKDFPFLCTAPWFSPFLHWSRSGTHALAGSAAFVHTGCVRVLECATTVGFSDACPHATSKGSLAKSTMQPSRL